MTYPLAHEYSILFSFTQPLPQPNRTSLPTYLKQSHCRVSLTKLSWTGRTLLPLFSPGSVRLRHKSNWASPGGLPGFLVSQPPPQRPPLFSDRRSPGALSPFALRRQGLGRSHLRGPGQVPGFANEGVGTTSRAPTRCRNWGRRWDASRLRGAYSLLTNSKSCKCCEKQGSNRGLRLASRAAGAGGVYREPVSPPTGTASISRDPTRPPSPKCSRVARWFQPHTPYPGVPRAAPRWLSILFPTGPGGPAACRELWSSRSHRRGAAVSRRVAGSGSGLRPAPGPGSAPPRSPQCYH